MCRNHRDHEVMLRCEKRRQIWRCLFCGHRTEERGKQPIATRFMPWRWYTELRNRQRAVNSYYVVTFREVL
jgi:hypothetical protein